MKQLVQSLRLNTAYSLFRRDLAFVYQITGNLDRRGGCSLAVSGLQEIQLALLNGEFHILHIPVMVFQLIGDRHEFTVALRQILRQLGDGLRRTHACHHVFALGIDQIFTENTLRACGRITGKGNAGTGGIAHISKYHGLYIDRGSPVAGNVVHSSVNDGAGVVPGTEYGLNRFHQLYLGILREFLAVHGVFVNFLESRDQLLQVVCCQLRVVMNALGLFYFVDDLLEEGLGNLHHNIGKHLNKSSVGIISKSGISCLLRESLNGYIVESQIQNGIHHAGHGCSRAGTNRYQERIFRITKFSAVLSLKPFQRVENLALNFFCDLFSTVIIVCAGFCCHCEALGNRQAQIGHFSQIGTFSAEKVPHFSIAFFEQIYPFCHVYKSLLCYI